MRETNTKCRLRASHLGRHSLGATVTAVVRTGLAGIRLLVEVSAPTTTTAEAVVAAAVVVGWATGGHVVGGYGGWGGRVSGRFSVARGDSVLGGVRPPAVVLLCAGGVDGRDGQVMHRPDGKHESHDIRGGWFERAS